MRWRLALELLDAHWKVTEALKALPLILLMFTKATSVREDTRVRDKGGGQVIMALWFMGGLNFSKVRQR
jgi:hypothetical protein